MIEFLKDYETEALPPEKFRKGQQVERSEASERYFVGRGLAGYLVDGKLVDIDHQLIKAVTAIVEIVQPGERRSALGGRAGEVMTGQPARATSGPGVVLRLDGDAVFDGTQSVDGATTTTGRHPAVLDAEIDRLTAENAELRTNAENYDGQFRAMNNSHVADKDALRVERDDARRDLQAARSQVDQLTSQVGSITGQLTAAQEAQTGADNALQAAQARIVDLERQVAEAAAKKPAGKA
jgi:hypothetical protein